MDHVIEDSEVEASVKETIALLTSKDNTVACDSSHERFREYEVLPPFYDEEKFKRGQQFYHKHIFAMFFSKMLGLMTIVSTPTILNVLQFTKKSSEPLTAYKRYVATLLHMCIWYNNDFKPGSELWRSIAAVKSLHNSASKRSCSAGVGKILQKDMGITQFGFMGYALVRSELVGIHWATNEEFEGFVHLWKVIGYILGMEDRFNICRDSVEETKQICETLIEEVFVPNIQNENPEYIGMIDAMITGLWPVQPFLDTKTHLAYMYELLNLNLSNNNRLPKPKLANMWQRHLLGGVRCTVYYLKYALFRILSNAKLYVMLWLTRNFPFLAYYKYGFENAHVCIYIQSGAETE